MGVVSDELKARTLGVEDLAAAGDETRSVGSGWTTRRVKVTMAEMELIQLGWFLGQAETQRPAWRLKECSIEALKNRPGRGRIVLVLEALEKKL